MKKQYKNKTVTLAVATMLGLPQIQKLLLLKHILIY